MELLLIAGAVVCWWLWMRTRRLSRELARAGSAPVTPGLLVTQVDGWAYWLAQGRLMRAPIIAGSADWARARSVDPLDDDLAPGEALEILQALESAQDCVHGPSVRFRRASMRHQEWS